MIFKRKKNKYDDDQEKKRRGIEVKTGTSRRGFLKFLGIGSISASSALISSAIPISAKTKLIIETEDKKLLDSEYSELPALYREGKGYLYQEETGRFYVYNDKLAKRSDMKILAPELCEKIHSDIRVVQEFERNFENNLKRSIEKRVEREIAGPDATRSMLNKEGDTILSSSIQRLPLKHSSGPVKWAKPEELIESDIMRKPYKS